MGGCHSSSDDSELPILPSAIPSKFTQLEKTAIQIPPTLSDKIDVHTSNGKITDFIAKNHVPLSMKYQQIEVSKLLGKDNLFQDKQFLPSKESIGPQSYPQLIEWKRPDQFMKSNYKVFQGLIQPADIKQGRLGDCYLLSAITAISQYPFIVKRIFQTTQPSPYGCYGIWLFVDGMWRCVVIDDLIPCHNGKPFFSKNHQNQLWVILLEKAYAKVFGSYQAIESGLTGIALNALTGAPYEYLNKDSKTPIDVDAAWDFLTQHLSQAHLLVGSTENNDRNAYLGLVSSHAYCIIDVQEVHISTKKGKKKERILKMSNPWGKYEWKGRWSEYSDVWSQQLRTQLKFEKADDGIFWINIEDFVENFGQICACKYNKNYINTSIPLAFPADEQNSFKAFFLKTSTRTQGYLTIAQRDHRFFSKNYEYSLVRVIILKMDKGTGMLSSYINDMVDCDRDGTIKVELDAGEYYVVIEMDWKCGFTRDIVVNFYGQHPVNLVEDTKTASIPALFNQIVLLHQKHTQKERIYQYAKDKNIHRITGSLCGYVYYHYSNKSVENNYLCETVALKERKFIEVWGQKDKEQFTVKVYPDEERIVKLRVAKEGNSFYSFATKIQFYIVEKFSLQKLKELADKKPTKVKKREIEGKEIDVRIKTYNYSGGIVLLYQNKMDKYAYIEEITFELDNLELENETLTKSHKLQIQLQPQTEKMLSFVVASPGKEIVFRTKMSFYLNAPQFKF